MGKLTLKDVKLLEATRLVSGELALSEKMHGRFLGTCRYGSSWEMSLESQDAPVLDKDKANSEMSDRGCLG